VWHHRIPENSLRHSQCLNADAIKAKGMDDIACPVVNEVTVLVAWQICNLEAHGSKLIPRGPFAARMHELNSEDEIIVHCKMGGRSAEAYQILTYFSTRLWEG
jgi:rhodanese-related sulfurtransferase